MGNELLSVKGVSFRYNDQSHYALKDISFSLKNGEWLAIVGHNGSGKSTLARILNGLLIPESGEVSVAGITLTNESIWDVRKKIGMVFQNPDNQFVGTTVIDDVAFGLENNGVERSEMVDRVDEAINRVKMEAFVDQEPHNLSGGQKQRVAIAGVLAVRPDIIILDEATSMLDPKGKEEVLRTIRKLKDEQVISVISITHDLDEASKADRILVMNKGNIFTEGRPEDIFALEKELVNIGLDLPFSVRLSKKMRRAGIPLTVDHLTDEGLVDELWTLQYKM
ncbi:MULTISPECIES: energy-coupling factor ABC transporter ATP-binding protein [Bacillaceae]|uniref:energy-coupling factor ABC transporter ATP-binding protein n=1 Tax=Bacillaceae TaxID=186817 RepID=UPI001BDF0FAC|nr:MULTISPECIES: energy-coupling factor ABC transporter ATP-binding protein [Bacillaceae]MDX8363047.1 energy-coupling factor ABC transporter ATP-binding protein [Cytobacillus sp. IB215316]MDX8367538.1 energy-coupling factor ABC transporter ATP-binding protein [Cytobacillus sp. IB215665]